MSRKKVDSELEAFEARTFEYAKEAGITGFKNGREVLAALERFASKKSNREAITEWLEKG